MSPSCAPSCAISAPATATWRRATCAPTSTSRCAGRASDFGTRCEIKNVNSIRFIGQAVEYEARRQIGILEDGGTIDQETRLFDPGKGETRSMRSKEEAHDYRYFPDPDLLPLEFDQAYVDALAADLPELPDAKKAPLHRRLRPVAPTTPRCWSPRRRAPTISSGRDRPRRQDGRQLGHQRAVRPR